MESLFNGIGESERELLARIDTSTEMQWSARNRSDVIEVVGKGKDISKIKLLCYHCWRQEFLKGLQEGDVETYRTMEFVMKDEKFGFRPKNEHGERQKVVVAFRYFFVCPVSHGKTCIVVDTSEVLK